MAPRLRLWPILFVLPLAFVVAVAALAGLAVAARTIPHYPAHVMTRLAGIILGL